MLLNKFYLSVKGRLFRMETICLFSFKGVISIYIWMGKYKPVYHGGHLLPSGLFFNMEAVKRKPNWSEKETLMLVRGERPRGSSLCKICGGWGQGDKIKRDRLGGGVYIVPGK
jgi:hypothetical protein